MTSSDPWNIKTAHIDWSEQVEEELQRGPLPQDTASAFPTLDEAAKTKGRKKKGGQQKISLSEFMSGEKSAPRSAVGRPLTDTEIMMMLPTAPREKDPNQPQRNWNARQGYQRGGYEREDRGRRVRERDDEFLPSRADESDNWGADRRGGRTYDRTPSRGSSRSGYEEREYSRAETDNWGRDNRFQPSHRYGGYEHDRSRRGYGFHSSGMHQRYGEDRWNQRGGAPTPPPSDTSSQGRKPLLLSRRTKPVPEAGTAPEMAASRTKNNPFGDARPREENLRERATFSDVFSSKSDIASDQDFRSQPGSPGGSFRGSSVSGVESRGEVPRPKPREDPFGGARPRADPFGGARPREEVLNERGNRSLDEEYKTENAAQQMEKIAQHVEAV